MEEKLKKGSDVLNIASFLASGTGNARDENVLFILFRFQLWLSVGWQFRPSSTRLRGFQV